MSGPNNPSFDPELVALEKHDIRRSFFSALSLLLTSLRPEQIEQRQKQSQQTDSAFYFDDGLYLGISWTRPNPQPDNPLFDEEDEFYQLTVMKLEEINGKYQFPLSTFYLALNEDIGEQSVKYIADRDNENIESEAASTSDLMERFVALSETYRLDYELSQLRRSMTGYGDGEMMPDQHNWVFLALEIGFANLDRWQPGEM